MSSNTIETLKQAQILIKQKQYAKAQAMLTGVNHPKAQEWLAKLEKVTTPKTTGRGKAIQTFATDQGEIVRRYIISVIIIIAMIGLLFRAPQYLTAEFGSIVNNIIVPIVLLVIGILLSFPALLAMIRKPETTIYTNGIEHNGKFTSWLDIDGIKGEFIPINISSFITILSVGAYVLYRGDEKIHRITAFHAQKDLQYQMIKDAVIRTHQARLSEEYKRSGRLEFGKLKLLRDGVQYEEKQLPYSEIGEVEVNGWLFIRDFNAKDWARISIDDFDNVLVAEAMLNNIRNGQI